MKCSLLAAGGVLIAASATAQPHPSTLQMTCGQAAALVASQGGIVLGTGGYTYDRFVAHRGFCLRSEVAQTVWGRPATPRIAICGAVRKLIRSTANRCSGVPTRAEAAASARPQFSVKWRTARHSRSI
jgi:hypothetical protein